MLLTGRLRAENMNLGAIPPYIYSEIGGVDR